MRDLHITQHAIERAMERIPGCRSEDQARIELTSAALHCAADFGAPYVRLGTGQRIVIHDHRVITVLPADKWLATFDRRRDHLHHRGNA